MQPLLWGTAVLVFMYGRASLALASVAEPTSGTCWLAAGRSLLLLLPAAAVLPCS
jgi:hypothetical protein